MFIVIETGIVSNSNRSKPKLMRIVECFGKLQWNPHTSTIKGSGQMQVRFEGLNTQVNMTILNDLENIYPSRELIEKVLQHEKAYPGPWLTQKQLKHRIEFLAKCKRKAESEATFAQRYVITYNGTSLRLAALPKSILNSNMPRQGPAQSQNEIPQMTQSQTTKPQKTQTGRAQPNKQSPGRHQTTRHQTTGRQRKAATSGNEKKANYKEHTSGDTLSPPKTKSNAKKSDSVAQTNLKTTADTPNTVTTTTDTETPKRKSSNPIEKVGPIKILKEATDREQTLVNGRDKVTILDLSKNAAFLTQEKISNAERAIDQLKVIQCDDDHDNFHQRVKQ